MRLIDADALMENLKQSHDWLLNIYEGLQFENEKRVCSAEIATFNEIGLRIKAAPTIDAEPVRHGHWTEDGCCSECGEMGLYNGNEEIVRSRYCPYCGEKMYLK